MPKTITIDTNTEGGRLRMARKERGITLQELASRVGCVHSSLQSAESGRTSLRDPLLRAVARELDVSPAWIRTGEGPKTLEARVDAEEPVLAEYFLRGSRDGYRRRLCRAIGKMTDDQVETLARLCEVVAGIEIDPPTPKEREEADRLRRYEKYQRLLSEHDRQTIETLLSMMENEKTGQG